MYGWRKFAMAVLSLFSFTLILILTKTAIDPFNLGLGIAFINGSYAGANALKAFAARRENETK
jgi:hypothetical protein